ncbi:outer dense fiber protein 3-B-like [Carassius auratus]|uniref:Outer dense fiber protein 3-B-like n=1 Tax=Carassius auratus TaxID=7957 RepID=A0A6P6PKN7_CARAU|nr:outer dense fiber protein 3-B-like [Carassius auratus]XP_026120915.1 outer dense fiber protein 3-B-like [Carassius auratus]XP_026120916.1 outer dense fiber protein 3-B-like [Carassius auratus]XP_052386927.1 outer dense fiber protein 3-B-like [Carassius gibelio]
MSPVEVWVGPWRPHRPRGPIAAMYNSPGPTYALPGATGINNHDPRMQKGPAFSFGTRHRGLQTNSSPGPSYLVPSNITRVGRDGTPAYSVYGRPKDIKPFQTPGPGSYSPENATKTTYYLAPAFSLSARTKLFRNDQTPGPAAYMLPPVLGPRVVNKASAPNVSFCSRSVIGSFHEDLRKTPGPGTYQVVDSCVYKHKSPEYSITGRNFTPGDFTKKPGPGAHHPEKVTFTGTKAPSYSFGIRHSEYIAPIIVDGAD